MVLIEDWNRVLETVAAGPGYRSYRAHDIDGWVMDTLPGLSAAFVQRVLENGQPISVDDTLVSLIGSRLFPVGSGVELITLRQLLAHQSGLDFSAPPCPADDATDSFNLWACMNQLLSRPVTGQVGYANENYTILRAVIEDRASEDYEAFVKRRIFDRAGCPRMSCRNDDPMPTLYYVKPIPAPGNPDGIPFPGAHWANYSRRAGSMGWYGSPRELARWLSAVQSYTLLSKDATDRMLADGLGWGRVSGPAGTGYVHNGAWTWGSSSAFGGMNGGLGLFSNGITAALLINTTEIEAQGVMLRAVEAALPVIDVPSPYVARPVQILNPVGFGEIRYTLDPPDSTPDSTLYDAAAGLSVPPGARVRATLWGSAGPLAGPVETRVDIVPLDRRPAEVLTGTTVPGLRWRYFEGARDSLRDLPSVRAEGITAQLDLLPRRRDWDYALEFEGFIAVPVDGVYTFSTTSDDGSRLWIGDVLLVDNDGLRGAHSKRGVEIRLDAGQHPIRVAYLQGGGGQTLDVTWSGPAVSERTIEAAVLSHLP